jgi:predicted lipoprotein with Yx(FWY)xxD motif
VSHRRRLSGLAAAIAAVAALAVALAAFAAASTATLKIGAADNPALNRRVAVNPQGLTLYELSPETTRHLLCRSPACLHFWPPLTVHSQTTKLKLGSGLHGRPSLMRRGHAWQVTLSGRPLYRYSGDHGRGQANGEGIMSFGGKWHTVAASGAVVPAPVAPQPYPAPPAATVTETTPAPAPPAPKPPPYPPY